MRESPSPRSAPTQAPAPGHSLPLWQLLIHTAEAVAAVQKGRSLTEALEACPSAARPGTQALSFAVMRQLGLAQHLRGLLVPRKPAPWVDALLTTTLALACDASQYTDHTLVDQAVNACKRQAKPASGMVNAVMRRFLRERDTLIEQARQDPVAHWNHPKWWIQRLQNDWPEHWQALLTSNQTPAPLMLRVNTRRGTVADYQARLQAQGLSSQPFGMAGLLLDQAVPVHQLPGFAEGDVSVQDASAQQAAQWLLQARDAQGQLLPALPSGARVLDACSAPGGKTAHLLEAADLSLLALDTDAQRLVRVQETLDRLGLSAQTQAVDAAQTALWWDQTPLDAIVLDAPCSASGIVRRHPDVRWLRRATDIQPLADIQDRLLDALWPLLKPGGRLLYCTCSVFKAEGEHRIEAFLQRQPDALRGMAPGHLLPVVEYPGDAPLTGDGIYYALLHKPA